MTKVKCSIENCSYNNHQACYAERVAIGGQGAKEERVTCCGTFLNQESYSNLAEHTEYKSPCQELTCTVATCKHNISQKCDLQAIEVVGENPATLYVDTDCASFEVK